MKPAAQFGVALVVAGLAIAMSEATKPSNLRDVARSDSAVGREAPSFALPRLSDGQRVALEDHRGHVVLIDFWATHCGPCRASMPHLNALERRFADDDFVIVSVNVDAPEPGQENVLRDFVERYRMEYDVLVDNGTAAMKYQARRIPLVYIVGRNGVVQAVHRGYTERSVLEASVVRALDDA